MRGLAGSKYLVPHTISIVDLPSQCMVSSVTRLLPLGRIVPFFRPRNFSREPAASAAHSAYLVQGSASGGGGTLSQRPRGEKRSNCVVLGYCRVVGGQSTIAN